MKPSILILGGTAESRALAKALAATGRYDCLLSLAGRTRNPLAQPVPVRSGGFGGADGLAAFLREQGVDLLIDATHPYAARISANAALASAASGVPLLALRRSAWQRVEGDRWCEVETIADAVTACGQERQRVFLTLGRQDLAPFEAAPQHDYLVRSVDPVDPPLDLPHATFLTDRGPFVEQDEHALLTRHAIGLIVAKNSGGDASYGKIAAARKLGITVILVRRPVLPVVASAPDVAGVLELIARRFHHHSPSQNRGE